MLFADNNITSKFFLSLFITSNVDLPIDPVEPIIVALIGIMFNSQIFGAEIRRNEQIDAGKILGLKDVVFLNYPDGYLEPTLDVRKDISKQIRIHKPQILITTNPNRTLTGENYIGHPDHFAAGEAALSAVYPSARDHLTFPELDQEGLEPHKVREVLIIGHDDPNIWFDITDSIDTAEKGLLAHKSQLGQEAADRTRERKSEIGKLYGVKYAEHFKGFVIR